MKMYVISISLQIAGALILLLHFFGKGKEEELLNNNYYGENRWHDSKPMNRDVAILKLQDIHISRISFIYIILGYLCGIWADISDTNKWYILFWVCIGTFIAISIAVIFSKAISKMRYMFRYSKENMK